MVSLTRNMCRKQAHNAPEGKYDYETEKDNIGNRGVLHVLRFVMVMVLRLPRASVHVGLFGGYADLFRAIYHGGRE